MTQADKEAIYYRAGTRSKPLDLLTTNIQSKVNIVKSMWNVISDHDGISAIAHLEDINSKQ